MTARALWLTKGLGRGGTERLLVDIAGLLDRSRFEMEVAYLMPSKDAFVSDLRRLEIPVHCLGSDHAWDLRWVGRLRRLVVEGRFDLVHTHMPMPAAITRCVFPLRPPSIVHTEHNLWPRYRPATYWANALTYRRNDATIAVSQGVAASIRRSHIPAGGSRPAIEVIIHGPGLDFFRPLGARRAAARQLLGVPADVPLLGSVGNFTVKKDHATMLQAVALLRNGFPELELALVGSGPLEADLRHQAERLGLGRAVRFLGSRDDIADLLPAFDLFVLSSRHEGLSIALLEALATGIPAVATRVGGIPEVVEDGRQGLLVPPGDPTAMASAVRSLLDDEDRRAAMGSAGIARARTFDLVVATRRLESVYEDVLSR